VLNKFVFSTPNGAGLRPVIAATRAGSVGVLDVERDINVARIPHLLEKLTHEAKGCKGDFGVRLGSVDAKLLTTLAPFVSRGLKHLIVSAADLSVFKGAKKQKIPAGVTLYAEITGRDDPKNLEIVDAIIIKGNEAAGFVGEESSFILFQHWIKKTNKPISIRGGITPHVAAALYALGANGVVLGDQIALLKESNASDVVKSIITRLSGTETIAVGNPSAGSYFRLLQHPKCKAANTFIQENLLAEASDLVKSLAGYELGWNDPSTEIIALGQEVALAHDYSERFGNVPRLLAAIDVACSDYLQQASAAPALSKDNAFSKSLGTSLPIIQGPMTRVSDNAAFAAAIAQGGALPMLALAVMKASQVRTLLQETKEAVAGKPWGVGLLGFLPKVTFDSQIAECLEFNPDFAIIAGGRPDQAVALEAKGIPTFLHLPSAKLLSYFVENGAKRFIFEGRECGGHIGPMSSFVLWSLMIDQILAEVAAGKVKPTELECVFAGGIHDGLSSALLQVMVAPLAELGVKIGIIMGTAYVFTKDIVESGAVLENFQTTIINSDDTVNLTTGPGHASRCARTPFVNQFFDAQKKLINNTDTPTDDVREELDSLILGTLRVASKGKTRAKTSGKIVEVKKSEQSKTGMFMIGQVASLRNDVQSIEELHGDVIDAAAQKLTTATESMQSAATAEQKTIAAADVAIIGISCALPGAMNVENFWSNILGKEHSVTEIPRHRWDWRLYFDEDRAAKDKIYSKWGGFLEDMPFDPMKYGITPKSILSVDPMQLMGLKMADDALADSGYSQMPKALREKTTCVIGASGGSGDVGLQYNLRAESPRFEGELRPELAEQLPEWSEDTFAGILINVLSGRISNRLDLGGPNFTTDAACASSLAAIYQAVNELNSGRSDMAVAGGIDTQQSPFGFMCFAQTSALSPRGACRSFDKSADGIAISEGIVMMVMKRLEDAEAAGDKIYAVIKGIGAGSDGKAKALNAPEPAGQLRAMRRAYEQSGYSPASVSLFEAHGTGTVAGDTAELESTGSLVAEANSAPRQAVIGSVKTNIGHTKASAGVAGMLKVALALHHKVLPPHRGVSDPNAVLENPDAPLYLLDEAEPWLNSAKGPMRGSVSAFGFGGTNFHATLEEYTGGFDDDAGRTPFEAWSSELFLASADDPEALAEVLTTAHNTCIANPKLAIRDISASYAKAFKPSHGAKISIVFHDTKNLADKLSAAATALTTNTEKMPIGTHFSTASTSGKVAAMFPGQGAQYTSMGRSLAVHFPKMARSLEAAETQLKPSLSNRYGDGTSLSNFLFPRGAYDDAAKVLAQKALTSTDIAQPALGAVSAGMWDLLSSGFGFQAEMFAGHSYGEFVAHYAAGALSFEDLLTVSESRGRLIVENASKSDAELGTMLAVTAERGTVEAAIAEIDGVVVANHNAPEQVIISGSTEGIENAAAKLKHADISVTKIPVAAAFHSSLMKPTQKPLGDVIKSLNWNDPLHGDVFSNATAGVHKAKPKQAMANHLTSPVNFVDQVNAMYEAGARVFVEIGPKTILSKLITRILGDKPFETVSIDGLQSDGLAGLLDAIGHLAVLGQDLKFNYLFTGRDCAVLNPAKLVDYNRQPDLPKHGWMINGSVARRASQDQKNVGVTLEEAQAKTIAPVPQSAAPTPIVASGAPTKRIKRKLKGRRSMSNKAYNMDAAQDGSISSAFFELTTQALQSARDVALAELGVELPESSEASTPLNAPLAQRRQTHKSVPMRVVPTPAQTAAPVAPIAAVAPVAPAPVAPKAVPPAAPAPAASGSLTTDDLKNLILEIVSEKTGYESDMLDFDQNLEADFGIDSIKRVDVVAGLMKALPDSYEAQLDDEGRSSLSTSKTLSEMLNILDKLESAPANFNLAAVDTVTLSTSGDETQNLPRPDQSRFILKPVAQSIPETATKSITQGTFLMTPCAAGLHTYLAEKLSDLGCPVRLAPLESLKNEASFTAWLEDVGASAENIAGVIHLAALDAAPIDLSKTNPKDWQTDIFRNEKTLFLMLKHAKLQREAHVVSVSGFGGMFARDANKNTPFTLAAGYIGALKTYHKERPDLRIRAIDLDTDQNAEALTDILFDEICTQGGRAEVGYPAGERHIFENTLAPVEQTPATNEKRVVLATGGARGITAETLRELGNEKAVLILTGRSPLPSLHDVLRDDPELAALTEMQPLTRHFVKSAKLPLGEARKKASRVIGNREMLDNITDLQSTGALVEYVAVDATDNDSVQSTIADLVEKYGPITGVVHGAGIIEDKLLSDISSDSWDRVISTKVIGMMLLLKHLDLESLDFFVAYGSVSGRYGSTGQTSYATANEIMNRLCCQLKSQLGDKAAIKTLNWGPWGATKFGTGMVTEQTKQKFESLGINLVHASLGRDLFRNEVFNTEERGSIEIVCGKGPWEESEIVPFNGTKSSGLIGNAELEILSADTLRLPFTLYANEPYLLDHIIDGNPVLPMAVAMEMMAQAVSRGFGEGQKIVQITDARLFKGVILNESTHDLFIDLKQKSHGMDETTQVSAKLYSKSNPKLAHYGATIVLAPQFATPSDIDAVQAPAGSQQLTASQTYAEHLFHGPVFQAIQNVSALWEGGIDCAITTSQPSNLLSDSLDVNWLFDPLAIDGIAQLPLVWTSALKGTFALPMQFSAITRYTDTLPSHLDLVFRMTETSQESVTADIYALDSEGAVVLKIDKMRHVIRPDTPNTQLIGSNSVAGSVK
jgi:acyl transferase domain-containing protein/NAD(P)H-dependent flavin oxidoreductase YrpB (nitropropane dioxygenase family)